MRKHCRATSCTVSCFVQLPRPCWQDRSSPSVDIVHLSLHLPHQTKSSFTFPMQWSSFPWLPCVLFPASTLQLPSRLAFDLKDSYRQRPHISSQSLRAATKAINLYNTACGTIDVYRIRIQMPRWRHGRNDGTPSTNVTEQELYPTVSKDTSNTSHPSAILCASHHKNTATPLCV